MEIIFPIVLIILAFLFLILYLFVELNYREPDETVDFVCIFLLIMSTILLFSSGGYLMFLEDSREYLPFAYLCFFLVTLPTIFIINIIMGYLGKTE